MRLAPLAAVVAAIVCAGYRAPAAPPDISAYVEVTRDGDAWTARFDLGRDVPAWIFVHSAPTIADRRGWREGNWRVLTPGVVLERRGSYDLFRAADGGVMPRSVQIAFEPSPGDLQADYDPALVFTDGSVALYSGQFDLLPVSDVERIATLPRDLNGQGFTDVSTRVTWRDAAGPVLFRGERRDAPEAVDAETYVVFGDAGMIESDRLVTLVDPGLPAWVGRELGGFSPRVADYYASRLGPGQSERPTIMVSWRGPTPGMTSMGGSVLPGLIVMSFEGVGVVEPSDQVLTRARWFIGHESAHFWLGQVVRYQFSRDAWITEGGADLMAVRALKALDPRFDDRAELQAEVDECIGFAAGRPLATAEERGEHKAYYGCGAVFAMVAEASLKGGDWFDFLRPLLDANREDGVLTRDEWLDALDAASGDPALRAGIERMLDEGVADPSAAIADLFRRSGVRFQRGEGGRITLL